MNYDTIILEMLSRIQTLEERVEALEEKNREAAPQEATRPASPPAPAPVGRKVSTADIRAFIRERLRLAASEGGDTLTLRSGEIHRAMGLISRMPQVCSAMRQCMGPGDRVVFETPSGFSSTLTIEYRLERWSGENQS